MKIGLFGGSFNPPHIGHLIVIESLQDQLRFDRVLFVPAAISPHKHDPMVGSAPMRVAMTKLAVEKNPVFEVSDIEVQRGGRSYTVDTIRHLRESNPGSTLSLIIGADNFLDFHTWKSPQEILSIADLIVMSRPGFSAADAHHQFARMARSLNVPSIGVSGTDIRRRVKHGRSIRYLVPEAVEEYIRRTGLYRE
jgi:nicotinate-nucleotide adenylyltransferase